MERIETVQSADAGGAAVPALSVMSFNVRVDHWLHLTRRWRRRREATAGMIQSARPDLAGLQEPRRHQVEDLARRLEGYAWTGVGRKDGKGKGEFAPIFYRTDRLELLDAATFWLSPTPEVPGSRGWGAVCRRVATWARLRDRRSGRTLFHFNTHFEPLSPRAKRESALLLLRQVRAVAGAEPTLVTVDLNGTENSAHYRILTAGGLGEGARADAALHDARELCSAGHEGPTGTWRGRRKAERASVRLDYVLVGQGVKVLRHATLTGAGAGARGSDHLPVMAEIVLE